MNGGFESLLALPEHDRRDVLEVAASRFDTVPGYVEKDFWVWLVLDALFNWRSGRLESGLTKQFMDR